MTTDTGLQGEGPVPPDPGPETGEAPVHAHRRGRTPPPWLTWLVVVALVAVYAGERIVPHLSAARVVLSGGGTVLVLAAVVWRLRAWHGTSGDARAIERLFLLAYGGCALALVGFFLAGDGLRWLGMELDDPALAGRFGTAAVVLASVVLAASLLPALAAQWAAGSGRQERTAGGAVDRLRVTQLAAAALTVGLAAPFLLLAGYVAGERDQTLDVSYFRTSSPGTASEQIVRSLDAPLRVLLFYPAVNQVKDQVRGYFRALSAAAGGDLRIEEHDPLVSPELAREHGVVRDGTVVLLLGDRSERIIVSPRLQEALGRLRILDGDVQQALMRLARDQQTVYLTVGHGELNDPATATALDTLSFGSIQALRSLLDALNYRVRDLGIGGGLGNEVPGDAAMVMVLGPRRPFLEAELNTLDRYLERGGSVLLALEPQTDFTLGPLRDRLGLDFHGTPLADDRMHVNYRGNLSDRRGIYTNRLTSHASLEMVSEAGGGDGVGFMGAGYLEPLWRDVDPMVHVVIHSLASTFADETLTFEFVEGREERREYPLAAVVEGEPWVDAEGVTHEMRAMVFADADMFSDVIMYFLGLNEAIAAAAIRWLGREEELSGSIVSEADVPITHTRAEDVAWFYTTILGAPTLVLLLGLLGVRTRRRRRTRAPEEAVA